MAQNRDRNWQDRDQRRGSWQGNDDFRQGEHGFEGQQGSWTQGAGQQSGWGGGAGQQQGGEWNRMGRYGEEGWHAGSHSGGQGGGMGWHGEGGNYRMDRDYGRPASSRGNWSDDGAGGMGSRGGYGSGSYGSGSYGTSPSSGYGSGYGLGSSGYGVSQRQQSGQQRGFLDRAADEVSSWFGDEDATRRRERDEHRGRGPKGYTRSDERIREDVNDRLTDDGWLDASDIEVQVSASEVTLTGEVASREEKRRAEDIADAISGVKHVQNNLRIKDRTASSTSAGQGSATQFGSGSTSGRSGASGSVTPGTSSGGRSSGA